MKQKLDYPPVYRETQEWIEENQKWVANFMSIVRPVWQSLEDEEKERIRDLMGGIKLTHDNIDILQKELP